MKKIIYLLLSFCSVISCNSQSMNTRSMSAAQDSTALYALRDSLGTLMLNGMTRNDTAMLKKAIKVSDELLKIDSNTKARCLLFENRTMMYMALGDGQKILENMKEQVKLSENDEMTKLRYNYLYAISKHNKDSVDYSLYQIDKFCDNQLKIKFNTFFACFKVQYMYYLKGKSEAKKLLKELYNSNKGDYNLKMFLDEWDSVCEQYDMEKERIYEIFGYHE